MVITDRAQVVGNARLRHHPGLGTIGPAILHRNNPSDIHPARWHINENKISKRVRLRFSLNIHMRITRLPIAGYRYREGHASRWKAIGVHERAGYGCPRGKLKL